jgi:NAD(P)-dependent dehydrogenase (short-subunit alcohol dehydrogenase family)
VEKYGRLDVFFANAGIATGAVFTNTTPEDFMEVMRVNTLRFVLWRYTRCSLHTDILISVFLAAKHAARAMLKNKPYPSGSIVATASVAGIRSNAGGSDYSASKAAVVSLMQTCAYQLAGTGIRCNAICPGIVETGMTAPMYEMARQRGTERKIGQLNPLKRGGVADEIARVVLFLASDEASYVNGQAWAVCGGLSAGHPFVPGKLA